MTVYNNKLDSWYGSCPGPVRQVLHAPYTTISDALHWVTGDPDKVAAAGATYIAAGRQLCLDAEQVQIVTANTDKWTGKAKNAFEAKMATLQKNLDTLGNAVSKTDEILKAAAETCVEAANMIIDIVKSVIEFLVSSLAIALATSVLSAGASVIAWVAANLAKGAEALAQVMSGLAKVAQVLEKVAEILAKVKAIFEKVASILKAIKSLLDDLKALKAGASIGERLVIAGISSVVSKPVSIPANLALDGLSSATGVDLPKMPGGVSEAYHGVKDGAGAVRSGNEAIDVAERNQPNR